MTTSATGEQLEGATCYVNGAADCKSAYPSSMLGQASIVSKDNPSGPRLGPETQA
jgi:hypothetical protein